MAYTKSQAQSGKGSVFSIGVATTTGGTTTIAYTDVGEVTSTAFSGNTAETVSTTNFNSGNYTETLPTIIDSGTCKLAGNRVSSDAGQVLLQNTFATLTVVPFKLVLPLTPAQTTNGDTITFNALVQSNDFTVDVTKQINFDVTLKISGPVVVTPGT